MCLGARTRNTYVELEVLAGNTVGVQVPLSAPDKWPSYQLDTAAFFVCAQIVPEGIESISESIRFWRAGDHFA
jgi:hypothetical protein